LLHHASGIALLRATDDVDIAVVAGEWKEFDDLKRRLVATGFFTAVPGITYRVLFRTSHKVDLVPFGGVERPNRSIAWPPDGDPVMNVLGFQEVLAGASEITLPGGVRVLVPSLAGLALTKLIAWADRRDRVRGKDAYDLGAIVRSYPPPGNEERLIAEAEAAHLFDEGGFDYEWAGAWLLGHDIAALLSPDHTAPRSPHCSTRRPIPPANFAWWAT
jgi:predicted nucleotidyltransferase